MEKESPDFELENGMESSRGGPLTTFIMTLPLIVVPAIAMLKPADSGQGLVSSVLSAASGLSDTVEQQLSDESDAPDFDAVQDEFDAVFGELSDDGELESGEQAFEEDAGQSLVDNFPSDFGSPGTLTSPSDFGSPPAENSVPDDDVERLLGQVKQMGATRTLWFSPDGTTVGFVAFFPTGPGTVSYRFEAMAKSKSAAVQNVLQQAAVWRESSRQ